MRDNSSIIKSWVRGIERNNYGHTLTTDGKDLYSYNLKIGYTEKNGVKVAMRYDATTKNFKSMTTSRHVSLASIQADRSVNPDDVQDS